MNFNDIPKCPNFGKSEVAAFCHGFVSLIFEGDELYTIVGQRTEPSESKGWTAVIMERVSRFIIDQRCGQKDASLFKSVMETVCQYVEHTGELSFLSDGERRYGNLLCRWVFYQRQLLWKKFFACNMRHKNIAEHPNIDTIDNQPLKRDEPSAIMTNQAFIPNYGDRYRYCETISTAFVESTVNYVISKRFVKKQQTRVQVLNDDLRDTFYRWYSGMNTEKQMSLKAAA